MSRSVALLCFCGVAAATLQGDLDLKNRPVTKVVTLLKDMVSQLQTEASEDEEVYETMGCWCETNDREKTKAIADAEVKIGKLNSDIEKFGATSAQASTDIASLQEELAKNTEALDSATALRQKQLAEFTAEEKDMLTSIGSLKSAIDALSKHHGASLLQVSDGDSISIMATIRSQLRKHQDLLEEVITPQQRKMLQAYAQTGESALLQEQYNPEYQSRSGGIFGVLSQMKETFEANLAKSQEEETTNQAAYEDMKAAKESEIKAGTDMTAQKQGVLADADEKKAQANQDLDSTTNTMNADTKYLASVKEHCANIDAEYEERVKTRQLEIQAVSKALAFLTSDDAQDLISNTLGLAQVKPAFLQLSSESRAKLSTALKEAARKSRDPRLSTLATRVRLDAFGKVKDTLQGMIDSLLKEKEEEISKKDFCVDSINQNERTTETKHEEKADAEAKAQDHANAMEMLTKSIAADKAEIATLRVELKRATENKEKENKDFQETVADQRATQKLLSAALGVLKGFYEKAALVQAGHKQPAGPPPPPGFKKYSNNAASGGVMNMIQSIVDDAKAMEADALSAEEASQQAYEDFTTDTNAAVIELQKAIATKTETHAREEQDKVMEEGTADERGVEIEGLMKENLDLHYECDFMIKNFEQRLESRDSEVEALKQGMATMSGATFLQALKSA